MAVMVAIRLPDGVDRVALAIWAVFAAVILCRRRRVRRPIEVNQD